MDVITNHITPYIPTSISKLCLLETDITEPELLVRKIAENTSEEYPECFQGEASLVFFRIRYTPPYESFTELKRLILQIRQATGIRSRFRGMICIDASEYKGHEEEEYFTILLKYLYDNSCDNSIVFVCCQYSEQELNRLMNVCMKYYPVHKETLLLFEENQLIKLIQSACKHKKLHLDKEGLKLITTALSSPLLISHRSLQLIDRVPDELCLMNCDKTTGSNAMHKLTSEHVHAYFSNVDSSICKLAGNALLQERRSDIEYAV